MTQKIEGFTPGPWYWNNSGGSHPTLFARPSLVVMDFVRMGMSGAQPRFSDRNGERRGGLMHKWGDKDFNAHPDAVLIAQAPTLYAENERLRAVLESIANDCGRGADVMGPVRRGCSVSADIVERLRKTASDIRKTSPMGEWHAKANVEAADEITRLREENDLLDKVMLKRGEQAIAFRAQRDAAVEALEKAVGIVDAHNADNVGVSTHTFYGMVGNFREVLARIRGETL